MKDQKSSGISQILGDYGLSLFWSAAFALSFCAFFYLAMLLFVEGYSLETRFLAANIAFMGGFVLTVMMLPGPPLLWGLAAYALLLFPTLVVSSYICLYATYFNFNIFYLIWGTTPTEAQEFLQFSLQRFPMLPLWALACVLVPALFLWPLVRTARRMKKQSFILRLGLFLVGLMLVFWSGYLLDIRLSNYAAQTYAQFFRFGADRQFALLKSQMAPQMLAAMDIRPALPPEERETFVLVIGESANRHHWGLYGYPRPTTPFMAARADAGEAFAFRNVCSTSVTTVESLYRALTFIDQFMQIGEYTCSLLDVFNRAGFTTWWISNNAVLGASDTLLEAFTRSSTHWQSVQPGGDDIHSMQDEWSDRAPDGSERLVYDERLLSWLDAALEDPAPKKMIVLHIRGSHIVFSYRYPASFDVFQTTEGMTSPFVAEMTDEQLGTLNAYDNSILYTDWFLEQVVSRLEKQGGRSWMLHFSDHGEEAFDSIPTHGRSVNNPDKYMLDVPFMVWMSPLYRQQRDTAPLSGYLDRPVRLDDAIHAALDLSGIQMNVLYDPTRSPFSDSWRMRPRMIQEQPYLDCPPPDLVNPATADQERELNRRFLSGDISVAQ